MSYYINKKEQDTMLSLMEEYNKITENGVKQIKKAELIMNNLYINYIDKIINGIIYSPIYKYYKFAELDDLINEARHKVYISIINNQFKPERGTSIFSFLSTVVSNNLRTYTLHQNRHNNKKSDLDLDIVFNNKTFKYNEDFDKEFTINIIFNEINNFFVDRPKYLQLANLLKDYFKTHASGRFIKKDFIEYAKIYAFNSSFVNSFFNKLKKIKNVKKILADSPANNKKFIEG